MTYLPSDGELELLQIIWELQPVTVRAVHERILLQKPVGYTTVLKQMQRMHEEKKILHRTIKDGIHFYTCHLTESAVKIQATEKLIQTAFRGSKAELLQYLSDADDTLSMEDDKIAAVRKWLEEKTGV